MCLNNIHAVNPLIFLQDHIQPQAVCLQPQTWAVSYSPAPAQIRRAPGVKKK